MRYKVQVSVRAACGVFVKWTVRKVGGCVVSWTSLQTVAKGVVMAV